MPYKPTPAPLGDRLGDLAAYIDRELHRLSQFTTGTGIGQELYSDSKAFEIERAAGVTIVNHAYAPFNVIRYGVDPREDDVTTELAAIAAVLPYLFFPIGTYRISSTIQRMEFSRWVGEAPQSNENGAGDVTPEVIIFGTRANIGDGNPFLRLCPSNDAGSSFVTEWISFQSDYAVDVNDLDGLDTANPNGGCVGVNIDHAKNGTEFINCSWRNLKIAIQQSDTDPYCDKVTLARCHITRCRLAIDADPTAGISLVDSFIYDCGDFIDCLTDVSSINCSYNNSSDAGDACQISARMIVLIGGWVEGGNNFINPSKSALVQGLRTSEMLSAGLKYLIRPQGDNVMVEVRGTRIPTNTRLLNYADISDLKTLSVLAVGNWRDPTDTGTQGTNFSSSNIDINVNLAAGLDYYGFGNKNTDAWNVTDGTVNTQNAAYTTVRADARRIIYHTDAGAHTHTIDSNANVPYPLGTKLRGVNENGAGNVTLAITSDTLRFGALTGARTIAANGRWEAWKVAATVWRLYGEGIT
jgi:hypothetical protein